MPFQAFANLYEIIRLRALDCVIEAFDNKKFFTDKIDHMQEEYNYGIPY